MRTCVLAIVALLALASPASAAELMAAYERYETGQGFQIGLVNAATGAPRALPAGVNTRRGRVPPDTLAGRSLPRRSYARNCSPSSTGTSRCPSSAISCGSDLQAGQDPAVPARAPGGTGPNFTQRSEALGPEFTSGASRPSTTRRRSARRGRRRSGATCASARTIRPWAPLESRPTSRRIPTLQIPHAAAIQPLLSERITNAGCSGTCFSPRFARYLTLAQLDPGSGALLNSVARLTLVGPAEQRARSAHGHAQDVDVRQPGEPRRTSRAALGRRASSRSRSSTAPRPTCCRCRSRRDTTTDVAPAPITTAASERMPAWSPDGLQLGFVRTTGGRRKLGVYDLTPGIQTIVNPLVDLGPDAPTPQTRAFQSIWGGMSVSAITAAPAGDLRRGLHRAAAQRDRGADDHPPRRRRAGRHLRRPPHRRHAHGARRRAAEDHGRRARAARQGQARAATASAGTARSTGSG